MLKSQQQQQQTTFDARIIFSLIQTININKKNLLYSMVDCWPKNWSKMPPKETKSRTNEKWNAQRKKKHTHTIMWRKGERRKNYNNKNTKNKRMNWEIEVKKNIELTS